MRRLFYGFALTFPLLLAGDNLYSSPKSQSMNSLRRIAFRIATIEEKNGTSNVISLTTVEGAPGTDFDIALQGARFRMKASFLTDLITSDQLKIRTRLDTHRLYGYSERNLPLFEEDNQRQTLDMGFDEAIVLYPFGRNGGDDRLKIEITPSWSNELSLGPSGELRHLTIKIQQASPADQIVVQARKVPHRFDVTATLFEDGREVANGAVASALLEESQEIPLKPNGQAGPDVLANPILVNLNLLRYQRSRPADEIALDFTLDRITSQQSVAREHIPAEWAGVAQLGATSSYDLSNSYLKSTGRRYELKLGVKLAVGEYAN